MAEVEVLVGFGGGGGGAGGLEKYLCFYYQVEVTHLGQLQLVVVAVLVQEHGGPSNGQWWNSSS